MKSRLAVLFVPALLLLAGPLFGQSPPVIPPGFILLDDEILPVEALSADSTWNATAWPGGVVPFDFDPGVTSGNQTAALDAMAEHAAAANVTFVPRTAEANYIRFFNSTGNNSQVGMVGGQQAVNIFNWGTRFVIVHELCHALGFLHEQQRPDRNTYVTINVANIQPAFLGNFTAVGAATVTGIYDFDSVMQYDQCAFSIDCAAGFTCSCTNHVIDINPPFSASPSGLGQRAHMSILDAQGIQAHYGAAITPSIGSVVPVSGLPSAAVTLTLNGARFCRGTTDGFGVLGTSATWDGTPITISFTSATQVTAMIPSNLATEGSHVVAVSNPSPGGGTSAPFNYVLTSVIAWGDNTNAQCSVPAPLTGLHYVEVAAGNAHTVARLTDGSVTAWGWNADGQCNVLPLPGGLTYVEVSAGSFHTLARRSDGSAVAWGNNGSGQCNVPALPGGLTYAQIAAGALHSAARRSDGSLVAWGNNVAGQCSVPALPAGLVYVEVATGASFTVARRSDGSVVAFGDNSLGQCNVLALPAGLTYVGISAGAAHVLALRSDGSLVAWGNNGASQCNVPAAPAGLTYVEAAAGGSHSVARLSDGTVVAWGNNSNGQCNVPALPPGRAFVEIAAGGGHTVARVGTAGNHTTTTLDITDSLPAVIGFVDLSTMGGTPILGASDDSAQNIVTTVGNALFPAGNVRIGNNGVAVAGITTGGISSVPAAIPASGGVPNLPPNGTGYAIPFWDDLAPSTGGANTTIWWKEAGGVLYIMWQNETLSGFPNNSQVVTFEVQVFANPASCAPSIQYLYPDSSFGGSGAGHDSGAAASVGYAGGGAFSPQNIQWSFNAPGVPTGTVLSIVLHASDFLMSSPFGPGSIYLQYGASACSGPGSSYVLAVTFHQGTFPNGWLFGVDIPFSELASELSIGAPFVGTGPFFSVGPFTGLPHVTVYAVVLSFDALGTLSGHSPAISYLIP